MGGQILNPFEIERSIFEFFINQVFPNLSPKVYVVPNEFITCYNNNIGSAEKVDINKLCGLVVFDINRFYSGEVIKEYEENYSIIVPFFVVNNIGNYRWVRPNIDISINLSIEVYFSTIYDKFGTLVTYVLSQIYDLIVDKGINENSPNYVGIRFKNFVPSQLILRNLSPIQIMPTNSSYIFRKLQLELRLLNC